MAIDPVTSGATAPSQSQKAAASLGDNFDSFLKLLVTQLRNQDPTDPTDTNQLAQQIATLSGVEQMIQTNSNLEKLISLTNSTQYNSVVSYIGKKIEASGNAGWLGDGKALFTYYLGQEADKVTITVKDQSGKAVYEGAAFTDIGRNEFIWNGKNNSGQDMPEGIYTFDIKALDDGGNEIAAKTFTAGVVNSVDSVDGIVYTTIGKELSVPLANITSILLASDKS